MGKHFSATAKVGDSVLFTATQCVFFAAMRRNFQTDADVLSALLGPSCCFVILRMIVCPKTGSN